MNNRVVMGVLGIIAVIGVLLTIIQSGNVSQTESKLASAQSTAMAQQVAFANQGTALVATLSAAGTQAADSQQKALSAAVNAGATVQANSVNEAKNSAATAQANALADAAQSASTLQAQALVAASQAAATAQAQALTEAANKAATAQANSVNEAKNSAATQQVQILATAQAQATATLGAVVNAAASAQAETLANAQAAATMQADMIKRVEAAATGTVGARLFQATWEAKDAQATQAVLETQIAGLNDQLATAQANVVTPVEPTAVPTQQGATVPKDWKRFVGKGVAIQLPNTYTGNELGSDPQSLAKLLRSLGPDFEAGAQLFEQNPDILALIAVNLGGSTSMPSSVIIVTIPMPVNFSVQMMLDATMSQLPSSAKVTEKSIVQMGEYEAGRVILETHIGTLISTQLQYYIITNNTLYLVGFTGTLSGPNSQLAEFERSMKTFEILAKPGI